MGMEFGDLRILDTNEVGPMTHNLAAGRWQLHTTHTQLTAVGSGELNLSRDGVIADHSVLLFDLHVGKGCEPARHICADLIERGHGSLNGVVGIYKVVGEHCRERVDIMGVPGADSAVI